MNLTQHFEKIELQGWSVLDFDMSLASQLKKNALYLLENKKFKPAGLQAPTPQSPLIRNDQIFWLEEDTSVESEKKVLEWLQYLRQQLKNYFRLALSHFEAHYAVYPQGHFYHKHSDQKDVGNKRFFSFVIYLNEHWTDSEGGELVIYPDSLSTTNSSSSPDNLKQAEQQHPVRILPQMGTLVLFRSDLIHEVLPSQSSRFSLTGWMRTS